MTDREVFQRNLLELMRLTKVKQIDIAKYAGVSFQTVSSWATGRAYPRADVMQKLCRFFGVKLSALTEDKQSVTQEDRLVAMFRSLSQTGQDKLIERADELRRLYPKRSDYDGKTEAEI